MTQIKTLPECINIALSSLYNAIADQMNLLGLEVSVNLGIINVVSPKKLIDKLKLNFPLL